MILINKISRLIPIAVTCLLVLSVGTLSANGEHHGNDHDHGHFHGHGKHHGKHHGKKKGNKSETVKVNAVLATGANIYLGETLWQFPDPWKHVTVVSSGALNPGGDKALALTADMEGHTVIVSRVDEVLSEFDTEFPENMPLRMVPTYLNADFERDELKNILDVAQDELGQSLPNYTITLAEWEKAKGEAKFKCDDDGASVSMTFSGMISNGLYTIWQTSGTPEGGLTAVPLGGSPNVFVPDADGDATFERELNACPFDTEEGTKPVLLYEIAYHSDALVYGGVPDSASGGLPFGLQTHTQLNIPINIIGDAEK